MFDISKSLKLQAYLNNQNLDNDMLGKLTSMRFNDMYTAEEFADIKYKVETYRNLDKANRETPTSEGSKRLKELSEDILYATGLDANTIQLSELFTTDILDKAFAETNLRSKNDLYVMLDYNDYSSTTNYVKCEVVGHDYPGAYGISANAKMVVANDGTIITTKNALYMK